VYNIAAIRELTILSVQLPDVAARVLTTATESERVPVLSENTYAAGTGAPSGA